MPCSVCHLGGHNKSSCTLSEKTLKEIKAFANSLGIPSPPGNKGHKNTWLEAIRSSKVNKKATTTTTTTKQNDFKQKEKKIAIKKELKKPVKKQTNHLDDLQGKTLKELKTLAMSMGIVSPLGNKGHKITWIQAIQSPPASQANDQRQKKKPIVKQEELKTKPPKRISKQHISIQPELQEKSLNELKAIAKRLHILSPAGHKGRKVTWIEAILDRSHMADNPNSSNSPNLSRLSNSNHSIPSARLDNGVIEVKSIKEFNNLVETKRQRSPGTSIPISKISLILFCNSSWCPHCPPAIQVFFEMAAEMAVKFHQNQEKKVQFILVDDEFLDEDEIEHLTDRYV